MRFPEAPIVGRLLRRYKRFFVDVELEDGRTLTAHCPNTGSLLGCLEPGSPVWLRDSHDEKRKLRHTWQAVRVKRTWVNVDTNLPNRVVAEAIAKDRIPELTGYPSLRREVNYGECSRIDVYLEAEGRPPCYVEVKNTTYALGRTALFPDAVTERGRKHLHELGRMAASGARAVQFFLISRNDVRSFRPADDVDPEYGRALREAVELGVEVLAYRARVRADRLELGDPLPIDLTPPAGGFPEPRKRKPRRTRKPASA